MDIPQSPTKFKGRNPIATDSALAKLLEQKKDFKSEDDFKGWKNSFLEVYMSYLDPAGVENAHASHDRLVRSLEKLASTVVSVNALVDEGKITTESQTVLGKRAMTNMTDQMAKAEKEIQRFMPTTAADEAVVGYDKFELAAVEIEDGFNVYELLKTTKDIIRHLQETVLNEVLPGNKLSIIQFYLRQIQSFCDIMADLGLFGLMNDVMEMYKIRPRSKSKPAISKKSTPAKEKRAEEELEEPQVVELDPNKIYNFRSSFEGGYKDPFSDTAPGSPVKNKNDTEDAEGEGEEDFIIYFDMKSGTIGKILRSSCSAKGVIVAEDGGFDGEIKDPEEKEDLLWKMKKALKGEAKRSDSVYKPPGGRQKKYVVTAGKDNQRRIGRSKSGDKNNLRGLAAPKLAVNGDEGDSGKPGDDLSSAAAKAKAELPKRYAPAKSKSFDSSFHKNGKESESNSRPAPFISIRPQKKDSMSTTTSSTTSSVKKSVSPKSPTTGRKNSITSSPETSPKSSPRSSPRTKRKTTKKVVKDPKPSSSGWATASSLAESRRERK